MIWPGGKTFAFTVIDDTDSATVENVKPIYDLLYSRGIRTTKTVWACPSRDGFPGQSLSDPEYRDFILSLKEKGFEIASHGAGSGVFGRDEILAGQELFRAVLGDYPRIFINHNVNSDCVYWGSERFSRPVALMYALARRVLGKSRVKSGGSDPNSPSFWGDVCKQRIRFMRNHTVSEINTLKFDPDMPCRVKRKQEYSNYWFSSSDGQDADMFCRLLTRDNVDRLAAEGGLCLVYAHFAYGFVKNGAPDPRFTEEIGYLSSLNGWFAPAGEILEYLLTQKRADTPRGAAKELSMDAKWALDRLKLERKHK